MSHIIAAHFGMGIFCSAVLSVGGDTLSSECRRSFYALTPKTGERKTFHFRCPHCNVKLEAEDDWNGMETQCPQCSQNIKIVKTSPVPPPLPSTPSQTKTVSEQSDSTFDEDSFLGKIYKSFFPPNQKNTQYQLFHLLENVLVVSAIRKLTELSRFAPTAVSLESGIEWDLRKRSMGHFPNMISKKISKMGR